MQGLTRFRQVLVMAGVTSLILATSVSAGASSISGKYSAADAKLVPAVYKGVTLQVATDTPYPPDEFMTNGTMQGFDIDLIYAVAKTLNIKVKENQAIFDGILLGIDSGKYQIGNSSFTDEKSREKQANFVDYFQAGEGVYAKSSSTATFTGLKSLCGFTVAVENTTTEQSDAQKTAKKCKASKKLTILSYSTQAEANLAVSSGRATFGFLDSQVAGNVVANSGGAFKLVGKAIQVAPYGIATPKSASGHQLAVAIQAAIKTMIANGTYAAILKKWGVTAGGLPSSKIVLNGAIF
jgi:polar amino acid transport system substrate-binding protein